MIDKQKAAARLSETRIMNCGMSATIINYRSAKNIDVQFEDGTIATNKTYAYFIKGQIPHPLFTKDKHAINRLNETRIMKCGFKATIIAYRKFNDIDIRFEDGIILKNKDYDSFLRGSIRHPSFSPKQKAQDRVGQRNLMKCGMNATIIAYRNAGDIDIQFDDGTILTGYRYEKFQKGLIPHKKPVKPDTDSRIGERKVMNCGLEAIITEYRNSHDIDIQFEDGVVIKNKYYRDFKNGLIKYPYASQNLGLLIKHGDDNHIGETRLMSSGITATIINYQDINNINIKFPDGVILVDQSYNSFKKGKCSHPKFSVNKILKDKIGETRTMNCGVKATIIDYKSWRNITVKFEDGAVQEKYRYEQFLDGKIPHPNYKYSVSISRNEFAIMYYLKNLGFRKVKQGEFESLGFGRRELDFYHDEFKIAIEYDGVIHNKGKNYEKDLYKNKLCEQNNIIIYRIREKGLKEITDGISHNYILTESNNKILTQELENILKEILSKHNLPFENINFKKDREEILKLFHEEYHNRDERNRLGMSNMMKCGMLAKIIAYRNSCDIDIQFEDGTVVKSNFSLFKKGVVPHRSTMKKNQALDRINETLMMSCGMMATIIKYENSQDIDIQFEDGTIIKNKQYCEFQKGHIRHPSVTCKQKFKNKSGEIRTMNCGKRATIINFRDSEDIDIQFDDGTILTNKSYDSFRNGTIIHPFRHKLTSEAA